MIAVVMVMVMRTMIMIISGVSRMSFGEGTDSTKFYPVKASDIYQEEKCRYA